MRRAATKALEREVFDAAYESKRVAEVKPSEHPDFLVNAKGANTQFGVEITELFLFYIRSRCSRRRRQEEWLKIALYI